MKNIQSLKIAQIYHDFGLKLILSVDGREWRDASKYIKWENAEDLTVDNFSRIEAEDFYQMPIISVKTGFHQPIPTPGKIVCIGLNYSSHSAEVGHECPAEPLVFLKSPTSICGPNQDVIKPVWAEKLDWEVELGVVIGRKAKNVSREYAQNYILGYVVVNDLSDRSAQLERGGQWTKGKSADGFCPVGPFLVTPEEGQSIDDLELMLSVNGVIRQNAKVSDMLFSPFRLIEYISTFMTLEAGDLILTGTPHGCSIGQADLSYLCVGDRVNARISGLGEQEIKIVEDINTLYQMQVNDGAGNR
ncbi:fumarylacetoacetate hydrolase family protein [Kiloniella sp. EL199]|uniref:fumarylacetoacetate hydrolase family protein n=1 Tax=Kiloniella sp. EL199 TaxID=2107581 RepID=UPI000EA22C58|nr:fumarylacetoacetate hydrolase family protein [Kiloniella sp. EL199]